MYSINGVPLDNSTFGWEFRAPSKPLSEYTKRANSLVVPGKHGIVSAPGTMDAPVLPMLVQTSKANLQTLLALVNATPLYLTVTSAPQHRAEVELMATSYDGFGDAETLIDFRFMLRINGAFWRDTTETIQPTTNITASSVVATVFSGMSAPIDDMVVRVAGPVSGLRVTDSGGSWWSYPPSVPSGWDVAFVDGVTTLSSFGPNNWDDYDSDVSGDADFGGPLGSLQITPYFTADPSARSGRLTVTTATRGSGANIRVRGKAAYLV